ncbi:oligosaccharide repeat unit polymerase [Hyphomicrobium sp. ghe19]|uniref:oligosaccharide repeat unit polymerase n=1 Tax=Hyphomicrobium sp. ghe19 TaxID=2682968 RepID=UPI001366A954|nr:hypothetical protein HYPP_03119 [Hyphomicrobium sp. ghe19]
MYYALLGLSAAAGAFAIFRDWTRWRDVFHPTIFCVPQLLFLYVAMPLFGLATDEFEFVSRAGYWDLLIEFQLIAAVMSMALVGGIWLGARHAGGVSISIGGRDAKAIFGVAAFIGALGSVAWIAGIINVGGFGAAYGRAYGGGWDDSGYVREAAQLGFVAAPLLVLSRRKGGMRTQDWMLVFVFLLPLLVQGLLGARRGPTFLAITGLTASYVLAFRPRIPFLLASTAAFAIGILMLWLVANRGAIYLGSDKPLDSPASQMLENWSGNEYLLSSAIVRYVSAVGEPFYGKRILAHMAGRIVPSAIWPTKYTDIVAAFGLDIDLTQQAGIPVDSIATVTGWRVANGAAPGLVGDFWMEFGMLAPLAAFAIGWLYGKLWRASRTDHRLQPVYAVLAALSIYILTQTIEAWLFRALLFGLPAMLLLKILARRPSATPAQIWHAHPLMRTRQARR